MRGGRSIGGFGEVLVSALTLFCIVSYAPFAIAALLISRFEGWFHLEYLVAMVFAFMAIGTLLNAWRTGTSLIVAPAVGMAGFVASTGDTTNISVMLLATLMASIVAALISRSHGDKPSWRQEFLNNIPRPVKVGVRGGIGALLASAAVENAREIVKDHPGMPSLVSMVLFVVGVLLLLWVDLKKDVLESTPVRQRPRNWKVRLLGFASLNFLVPIFIILILVGYGFIHIPPSHEMVWPTRFLPVLHAGEGVTNLADTFIKLLFFSAVILFIFITDIPGSPYDLLNASSASDVDVKKKVDRSFFVTAIISCLQACFGLFTAVYYAENHILTTKRSDVDLPNRASYFLNNRSIAIVCAILFAICAFLCTRIDLPAKEAAEVRAWLLLAVSPSLFCLGIHLTANAMKRDLEEEMNENASSKALDLSFFVPVSFTILLTHFLGFEVALPLGIIFFSLASKNTLTAINRQKTETDAFRLILSLSYITVIFFFIIKIAQPNWSN